jgi:predicted small lipoprotein YifL
MQMRRNSFILPFILVVLIAVTALTGCAGNSGPGESPDTAQNIGQGGTVFRFEVTDNNQMVTAWDVHTNETTVGAALLAVGLIEGEPSDFGLEIKYVNGLRADFTEDKAFWAFHVDGGFAMSGVDSTDIETDKTYALVYTPA